MLRELEAMLCDVFTVRETGAVHPRVSHARGCADGYMRALLDAGLVDQRELLGLVARVRTRVSGPATIERDVRPAVEAVA